MEGLMRQAATVIVNRAACLRKGSNVLVICGLHNKGFAEDLVLESYATGAYPHLCVFDERLLLKRARTVAEDIENKLPNHTRSLLENSDLVIWLTQFENPKNAQADLGMAVCAYWDRVYETVKGKPLLLVNLLSAKCLETMKIDYETFLVTFAKAVNVDYDKVRKTGLEIIARLDRRKLIRISDSNGTDLTFSIENRRVGIEAGTLEDCYSIGRECEVEVPAGEVYVAPKENSAYGTLVTDELRDFDVRRLKMDFEEGKIARFRAEEGEASFRNLLEKAQGDKDRIAEFGIGINHGMKPIGLRIYDEKALGTAHIAIGNNTHLGEVNKASIHIDFILHKPSITADNELVMEKGEIVQ